MSELPVNQILCGDCVEVMRTFPSKSVDLVITDPPYSTPVITAFGRQKVKNVADLSIQGHFYDIIKDEFERITKENGRVIFFCDDKFYPILFATFYNWLNLSLIIWDKKQIGMGRPIRKQHELLFYVGKSEWEWNKERDTHCPSIVSCPPVIKKVHEAEKPIKLLEKLICGFSRKGDVILDPMCGSGTTCIAAHRVMRDYIGIDLNPDYCKIARKRMSQVEWPLEVFI